MKNTEKELYTLISNLIIYIEEREGTLTTDYLIDELGFSAQVIEFMLEKGLL